MPERPPAPESEYYGPYAEFSKTLRTWFVAYGVGGPVVLLTNDAAWKRVVDSGCGAHIGSLFLIGGALQICSALFNKHAMWHLYICEPASGDTESLKRWRSCRKQTRSYRFWSWYSDQNWIDELLDLLTVVTFAWATALASVVLTASGGVTCDPQASRQAWTWGVAVAAAAFAIRAGIAIYQHVNRRAKDAGPSTAPPGA